MGSSSSACAKRQRSETTTRIVYSLKPWNPTEWKDPELGNHLAMIFNGLGYTEKMFDMLAAYMAGKGNNLALMKKATGNSVMTEDINYIWTSAGRMALMLDKSFGNQDEKPHPMSTYDPLLRAWVLDLEHLYDEMMGKLRKEAAESADVKKEEQEKLIEKFDKKNTCDDADWANGISLQPTPKFFLVSEWIRRYFADEVKMTNKIYFYKAPGTTKPPFVQIKVHRTCFFFKGTLPGSVLVNPEFALAGANVLREDLEPELYDSQQFTLEVIDKGKAGKLTVLDDRLYILPMAPKMVNKFDPTAADFGTDAQNSYLAFKNSHPDTIHDLEVVAEATTKDEEQKANNESEEKTNR